MGGVAMVLMLRGVSKLLNAVKRDGLQGGCAKSFIVDGTKRTPALVEIIGSVACRGIVRK